MILLRRNAAYDRKSYLVSVQENAEAIEFQMKLCGYFCFVTSEPMTAVEARIHYKGRDVFREAVQADKSFIGAKNQSLLTKDKNTEDATGEGGLRCRERNRFQQLKQKLQRQKPNWPRRRKGAMQ